MNRTIVMGRKPSTISSRSGPILFCKLLTKLNHKHFSSNKKNCPIQKSLEALEARLFKRIYYLLKMTILSWTILSPWIVWVHKFITNLIEQTGPGTRTPWGSGPQPHDRRSDGGTGPAPLWGQVCAVRSGVGSRWLLHSSKLERSCFETHRRFLLLWTPHKGRRSPGTGGSWGSESVLVFWDQSFHSLSETTFGQVLPTS